MKALYPQPSQLLKAYNPHLQTELRRRGLTLTDVSGRKDIPTLGMVAEGYGTETAASWVAVQVTDLVAYAGCGTSLSARQMEDFSDLVVNEYGALNLAELTLFFARFKAGQYGRFYGQPDPMAMAQALMAFAADCRSARSHRLMGETPRSTAPSAPTITTSQAMALMRRAALGDEAAATALGWTPEYCEIYRRRHGIEA